MATYEKSFHSSQVDSKQYVAKALDVKFNNKECFHSSQVDSKPI